MKMGKVKCIKISKCKGKPKEILEKGFFRENHGLEGDIHSGAGERQVSLLGWESIEKIKQQKIEGLCTVKFSENITIEELELYKYSVGTKFAIGEAVMEISQVGKGCYKGCPIPEAVSECILPKECIFAKIIKSGWINQGDSIEIIEG